MSNIVGTVINVTRYPVKSMAGECLAAGSLTWQGFEGDRQYGFLLNGDASHPFRGLQAETLLIWSAMRQCMMILGFPAGHQYRFGHLMETLSRSAIILSLKNLERLPAYSSI